MTQEKYELSSVVEGWKAEQLRLRPYLLLVAPYELEATYTVPGTSKTIYVDHHWDSTFGYAFGTVALVGRDVTEIAPGDFIHFTRHAYESRRDENGDEWLFVNKEDCLAKIVEVAEQQGGESADHVE